ncbi:MAG TPA: hypothetical protein VL651_06600, partial [Bacteroidia bacterium]|nr:hypothetical protein [Bacteroidia bacterium]
MINGLAFIPKQLKALTGVFLWGTLVAFCAGCSTNETKTEEVKTGKVLARVFDNKLYESEVTALIPKGTASEDSLLRAQNIINNWVREKLLIHKAELNLSKDQQNVEQQLQAYKNSLIIYAYEKELVLQKLDT